ncbi:hypothetical protein DVH05_015537 [Phytophthora capsici]|nr:hypothetical protein DVH05_015537 [Phytophthora capsici]
MTLAAFWTVGCRFEGQQNGLSEAWFAIYPAIVNFVLIYYSLLNLAAKALRRRMSDVLFAPTVIFLCLLHYFRLELAASGWLKGVDGRIVTVVFSDEAKKLQLADYFTTDIAWRMNGRVRLIFGLKLAIIGVNLLPLLLCRSFPRQKSTNTLSGVEKALALRVNYVGGLGRSLTYAVIDQNRIFSSYLASKTPKRENTQEIVLVNSYELIRLGYIVFGDRYLISFDEWELLSSMAPFRDIFHLWNHRVLVWTLRPDDVDGAGGRALESVEPQMLRLDDHRLQEVRWWQISACGIQC